MSSQSFLRLLVAAAIYSTCSFLCTAQTPVTARHLLPLADSVARSWTGDTVLASIETPAIDTTGRASRWIYRYIGWDTTSLLNSRLWTFAGQDSQVNFDQWTRLGTGLWRIINSWMDSDSALLLAERAGGRDLRRRFPSCKLRAFVGQTPAPPFDTRWEISYSAPDSTRWAELNATTGEVVRWKSVVTSIQVQVEIPRRPELAQNYPNPFNPSTLIRYNLPHRSKVTLTVYNSLGQQVAALVNGEAGAGDHEVQFDANGLASGVYFYRLQAEAYISTKAMLVVK